MQIKNFWMINNLYSHKLCIFIEKITTTFTTQIIKYSICRNKIFFPTRRRDSNAGKFILDCKGNEF